MFPLPTFVVFSFSSVPCALFCDREEVSERGWTHPPWRQGWGLLQ